MTQLTKTQKIGSCLWFDNQAEEAVNFYTSIFKNAKIGEISRYGEAGHEAHGRPAGSVMTIEFQLEGQTFTALNGGPHFKFTPAVSFFIICDTEEALDKLWEKLSEGGKTLMPLQKYPFSEKYGWTADKYGLTWQVTITGNNDLEQKLTPSLMFVGEQAGKAEEAINFYASVFDDSKVGGIFRYGPDQKPDKEGTVEYGDFILAGQTFIAMDSALEHDFTFNEAISLVVHCETQEEVDGYWEKLSAVPGSEQCGWLKDKFGVSWQIIPKALIGMMNDLDPEKFGRIMEAMLQMKKIDIAKLKQAHEQ
ncbi:MAG: VOC family protein [Anditalea sp.]